MTIESYVTGILREVNALTRRISVLESKGASGPMYTGKARNVVLSGGAITVVFDYYILFAETGTVDDLDSLNFRDANVSLGGKKVFLRAASGATITVKDGTGNIDLTGAGGGDISLDDPAKSLVLVFDLNLGKWIVYSNNT